MLPDSRREGRLSQVRLPKASATGQRSSPELVRDAEALAPVQTFCTTCL